MNIELHHTDNRLSPGWPNATESLGVGALEMPDTDSGVETAIPAGWVAVALMAGGLKRGWRRVWGAVEVLFGAGAMVVALAVLVPIPRFQCLAVGYFLEAAGRIARGGRLREALPG